MTIKLKRSIISNGVTVTLNKLRETEKAVMLRYSVFVKPLQKTFNLKAVWIPKSLILSDNDEYIEFDDRIREFRKEWFESIPDIVKCSSTEAKLVKCSYCRETVQFPQLILLELKGSEVKNVYSFCSWMCLFDASGCEISREGEGK